MNPLLTNFVLHVAMLVSILKQVGIFTCTNTPNNSLWDSSYSTINITVNKQDHHAGVQFHFCL